MPAVARLGDPCTGHGAFPPRQSASGNSSVLVNGQPAHCQGDSWDTHCDPNSCHDSVLSGGSGSVLAGGKPLGRVGDAVACGSTVAEGSPNVLAGD